ncbi:MAG: signal peptidase II [Planctomycetota bacterium]|nr:MAG: signal peptidase II [Planctomycetota bacterium]
MTELKCCSESENAKTHSGDLNHSAKKDELRSAHRHLSSHLRLWPVAIVGLVLDLTTKNWAFNNIDPVNGKVIIQHLMSFHRSLNSGALFGLGKGWTPLFIIASLLALGFVLYLFIHSKQNQRSLHIGLALVLAGALGNLYDRAFVVADVITYTTKGKTVSDAWKIVKQDQTGITIGHWPDAKQTQHIPASWNPRVRQQGVVRDFIQMKPRFTIGNRSFAIWPWVFNIADVLLVAGVGLLLLNFWWDRKTAHKDKTQTASSPP